jgi:glutathione peroxidase
MASTIYEFSVKNAAGEEVYLEEYKDKNIIIVNVASKCGFTPQYEGLEKIYKEGKDHNLIVLGFPCNQFGKQEPGSDEEIQGFCQMNYGVSFPVFSKIDVNGENTHPLYQFLKSSQKGLLGSEAIKWNFTKFWIGKDGIPKKRFAPQDKPESIWKEIKNS